jgi:AraC family transcriptional regulator
MASDNAGAAYAPGEANHFDLCTTRRFRLHGFQGDPRSEHEGLEMFFTARDTPLVRVGSRRIDLVPDRLLLFNAAERHGVVAGDGVFYGVVVPPAVIAGVLGDEIGIDARGLVFDDVEGAMPPAVAGLLAAVFASRSLDDADPVALDAALVRLVVELLATRPHAHRSRVAAWAARGTFPAAAARVKALVHDTALEAELGLEELARTAGLSKFHFLRCFKRATGHTPASYRMRLRIEAAKRALRADSASIGEIAASVGFVDLGTFGKAFKRATGRTPTAYRDAAIKS